MTELETLQMAKTYLDKLVNGIDPLTDRPVPESDCVNQVRISRCLFYVSDVLRRVIENGGAIGKTEKAKKAKKRPFTVTREALAAYPVSDAPIPVSEIVRRINELIDTETMTKLKTTGVTGFLLDSGLLREEPTLDGRTARRPTELGRSVGISVEERVGQIGTYHVTVYNADAQQFLLDNVESLIRQNALPRKRAELQGKP